LSTSNEIRALNIATRVAPFPIKGGLALGQQKEVIERLVVLETLFRFRQCGSRTHQHYPESMIRCGVIFDYNFCDRSL
jgi:hypothetical protein